MAAFAQYLQTWEAGMRRCFSSVGASGIAKGRGDVRGLGWVSGWSPAPSGEMGFACSWDHRLKPSLLWIGLRFASAPAAGKRVMRIFFLPFGKHFISNLRKKKGGVKLMKFSKLKLSPSPEGEAGIWGT